MQNNSQLPRARPAPSSKPTNKILIIGAVSAAIVIVIVLVLVFVLMSSRDESSGSSIIASPEEECRRRGLVYDPNTGGCESTAGYVAPQAPAAPGMPALPSAPAAPAAFENYATVFTVEEQWASGARNKAVPGSGYAERTIGTVRSPGLITSIKLSGEATDQGWGNFCSRVGLRVFRGDAAIYTGYKSFTVHGWQTIDHTIQPADPVEILPGDRVAVYIQGLYNACSCTTKNFSWTVNMSSNSGSIPL